MYAAEFEGPFKNKKNRISSMKNQRIARILAGLSLMALGGITTVTATPHTVSAGWTAAQLVDELIPTGSAITVTPFSESYGTTAAGPLPDFSAIGKFAGGNAGNGLPFASGVVLTTGRIGTVLPGTPAFDTGTVGPNDHERTTHVWGTPGSPSLESEFGFSAGTTFDAAKLSFKFTSTANAFSFQYMFGSEEYAENVGLFNDAFAFLLTDTVTHITKNLAVLPDSTPISINTVNAFTNPSYFTANPYSLSGSPYDIEADGLAGGASATKLFASSSIVPGREYQIEMVIADSLDPSVDAMVFLGADSFVDVPHNPVPEPSTYIGAIALAGLVASRLRRKA